MSLTARSFFHPISKQFFDKIELAGGSVSDKNSVNNFVEGLSRIIHPSLWVCWPLRSTQNIGTGTTAYSLGGLGNFNGTLTNSPTWGVSGVDTSGATNRYITTPASFDQSRAHSIFWVGAAVDISRARGFFDTNRSNPERVTIFRNSATVTASAYVGGTTIDIGATQTSTFFSVAVSSNGASSHTMIDGTVTARSFGTLTSASSALLFGNNNAINISNGNNAVAIYFLSPIGTTLASVYTLYKSTIGQGLGLQ